MSLLKTLSHEISTKGNIYKDGEKSESAEDLKISLPELRTNSSQMRNDSAFNASSEDIFTSQDKEYLLLLVEIQNTK